MSAEEKQLSAEEQEQKELRDRLVCIDPNNSVVVTACAGSGKTWLLTSRIIRIIIENADRLVIDEGVEGKQGKDGPGSFRLSSILAITFTKNAAAEIEDRVRKELRKMARADAERLKVLLSRIGLKENACGSDKMKEIYRKFLLARPPLSVFTFHSWFHHLINYLPWELRPNLNSQVTDNPKHLQALAWQETLMEIRDDEDLATKETDLRQLVEKQLRSRRDEKMSEEDFRLLVDEETARRMEEVVEAPKDMRLLLGYHSLRSLKEQFDSLIGQRTDWFLYFGTRPEDENAYGVFKQALEDSSGKPNLSATKESLLESSFVRELESFLSEFIQPALSGYLANKERQEKAEEEGFSDDYKKVGRIIQAAESDKKALLQETFIDELQKLFSQMGSRIRGPNGTAPVIKIASALRRRSPAGLHHELADAFLKKETLKKAAKKPGLLPAWESIHQRVLEVNEAEAYKYNSASARIGLMYARNYARIKQLEGVIDYVDMEMFPLYALFMNVSQGNPGELNCRAVEDLLLRLDNSYDHILVDEFQDTNPLQWLMLKAWLDHSGKKPSVFIVGDPKQSIYSWRGSKPELLGVVRRYVENNYDGKAVSLATTRRCSQSVVDIVNKLFANKGAAAKGQLELEDFEEHMTSNLNPGSVICLPPAPAKASPKQANGEGGEDGALRNPLMKKAEETDENAELAAREGEKLGEIIDPQSRNEFLGGEDYSEEDFMLLHPVKTHAEGLTNGLASHGLKCGLVDRGGRMESLECQDILALLHAIFDPGYGLMLAQTLRSPIFNISEDDLWKVYKAGLQGKHCDWKRGLDNAEGSPELDEARTKIEEWRKAYREEKLPAHELLARCYHERKIVKRYVASVPEEMAKRVVLNLEWVLNYSLEALNGRLALPSEYAEHLEKLKEASEDTPTTSKQEHVVQSLTIHGAKGLQSPVVAIVNCNYRKSNSGDRLLVHWDADESSQKPSHVSFYRNKTVSTATQYTFLKGRKAAEEQEKNNLLYVAMTRAKDHLIFSVMPKKEKAKPAGEDKDSKKSNSPPSDSPSWWNKASECLQQFAGDGKDREKDILVHIGKPPAAKAVDADEEEEDSRVCWPTKEDPPTPEINTKKKEPATEDMVRGTQLHNLLALILQGVSNASVQRRLLGIGVKLQDDLKKKTDAVLDANEEDNFGKLRDYIAGDASSPRRIIGCEVPAVDRDGGQKRIDCLLTPDDCKTIWIVDFKMGRAERQNPEHENQLREYYAIVSHENNYPDAKVKMAIVYEDGSRWIVT